jgi:maltoporin
MKTFIALTALTLASMFLYTGTAIAWDELISNDTSYISESGTVSIGGKLMYRTASKMYDQNSKSQDLGNDMTLMAIPLRGKYSVNDFVQTFALIQIISADNGIDSNTGLGDIWLGAKWAVRPDGLFTIRGALDLPIGDDKKGLGKTGGYGLDVGFMTGIRSESAIDLSGQFGLRYNSEDTDTKIEPGIGVYLDGQVDYNFTEKFGANIGLEFMSWAEGKVNNVTDKSSEINWLEVSIGPNYKFNDKINLYIDVTYDILGKNTPLSTGVIAGFFYNY